jgi:hypothetical protein
MAMYYSVYGLRLEANVSIPGLTTLASDQDPNVQVWLDAMPWWLDDPAHVDPKTRYTSPDCDGDGRPRVEVQQFSHTDSEYFRLTYADGTAFLIDRAGTRIWSTWPDTLTVEDTAVYLLGPIIGFALRLRGITCLHASAVAIAEHAIALLGTAGAGKSTTAAAFARLGYAVLSEDVVALEDSQSGFSVQPGYPHIRLWPTSAEILYRSPDALPPLTPNWDKRYLDLLESGYAFQYSPLPLAAVYVLGRRCPDPEAPFVEEISAREALMTCVENTYGNYLLEPAMRAKEFTVLSRLVERVPVRRVNPHVDPARLSRLCDAILEDSRVVRRRAS